MSITWIKKDILAMGPSLKYIESELLFREGLTSIINLEEEQNYPQPRGIEIFHLPIKDFSIPDEDTVERFLVIMQHHFEQGKAVYVHCTAGCGRSGTMVAIWMASLLEWNNFENLLSHLRELRSCAIETDNQLSFVRNYFIEFNS